MNDHAKNQEPSAEDHAAVAHVLAHRGRAPEALIPILQDLQLRFRFLPDWALRQVCDQTDITPANLVGVATFYDQFRLQPVGRMRISVCHGTACHVKNAQSVTDLLRRELKIPDDGDTDPENRFTVEKVACLGCCTLAPVMRIDDTLYGHLDTPESIRQALHEATVRANAPRGPAAPVASPISRDTAGEIHVCTDSCCNASGASAVFDALESAVRRRNVPVAVRRTRCVLMCSQIPVVEVFPAGESMTRYARVQPADAAAIVRRHFPAHGLAARLRDGISHGLEALLTDNAWQPVTRYRVPERDRPLQAFFGPQRHIALEHYGQNDPLDLDAYCRQDGFAALGQCRTESQPERIIAAIRSSGLRGRGGAGFPTGEKWHQTRQAPGSRRYLICNGDEGDPGAFMDRMLLETFPYRVIEGMHIAATTIGAAEAILFVRAEYPRATEVMREALRRCADAGLLSLPFRVFESAGAFVCGEETALIASMEGRRGMPRLRPPFPAERGLFGAPTCVNNVETLAKVPWILRNGPDAFAAIGTPDSRGTKVFALAGKVMRGGLIEVPMGTTIRDIVDSIGGGVAEGRRFKAVQIGGPSGGCIPARLADTPIDYTALQSLGAIMGSGGLVVLDDTDCMVDVARYFLQFTQEQSCGKCTFCRIGTRRMLDVLERICGGQGRHGDLERLEELGDAIVRGSLCGLGQTAPIPVQTALRYYRDEFEAHLKGQCPAASCKALITYRIGDDCIGCTRCAQVCPADAIEMKPKERHAIEAERCIRCGACRTVCPVNAVTVT